MLRGHAILLLSLSSALAEVARNHLVNIEEVFYWKCPDLSGRKHRRGAVLEDGCFRSCSFLLYIQGSLIREFSYY